MYPEKKNAAGTFPSPDDPSDADHGITADRQEVKYRVDGDRLDELLAALTLRLPRHRFTGEGANGLPDPQHFVSTIYFDTPSRALYRAACVDGDHNVKLRVREYYDLHPSLVELATDPSQIVRYQPWVWLELKTRDLDRATKQRIRLRKRDVPRFLASADRAESADGVDSAAATGGGDEAARAIIESCRRAGEPLSASCLVNYRRFSWQTSDGALRVTVDRDLAFFAPPADLWQREQTLLRSTLGPVRGRDAGGLVEIKHRTALPAWVAQSLTSVAARAVSFSKFVASSAAVGGP
ncbi:MAG TPA: VTC domain-containing protein [Polyangia bacterium]|nr:VTC domain-containing protein [Polyangia bacterium]